MKKFLRISVTLIFIALFAALLMYTAFLRLYQRYRPSSYLPGTYEECAAVLDNPFRGFHHMYGFTLSEDDPEETAIRIGQYIRSGSLQLMLIQVNLKNYANSDLSENALQQLHAILSECRTAGRQVILRFLYDWDGKALETEPDHIEQIYRHMDQIGPVVNEYADAVFVLQSTFTGNCGEMTQTKFGSHESNRLLMTHLSQVTDPSIYLAVRTPSHLRGITQTRTPVSEESAFDGSLGSRLGLFNDGMLGSVYDLGTYDDTSNANTTEPEDKGTREEELAFQEYVCQFVPNGGEAIQYEGSHSELENAIPDLARMHISYLNTDHHAAVMESWRESVYHGDDCFDGMSGYDYIDAHLGYRYMISASSFSSDPLVPESSELSLTIRNTGFAPAYRVFEGVLSLENRETGLEILIPAHLDNRTVKAGGEASFTFSLDIRHLPEGSYLACFALKDPYTGRAVLFSNEGAGEDGRVPLGTLTIDPASPEGLLSYLLSHWQNR